MNKNKLKKNNMEYVINPSLESYESPPETCSQMINRFGRCNVQATADTDNHYPAIAQGLAEKMAQYVENEQKQWRSKNGKESGGKYKH